MTQLEELLLRFFDAELEASESAKLLELLDHPESARQLRRMWELESALHCTRCPMTADRVIERIEHERTSRIEHRVMDSIIESRKIDSRKTDPESLPAGGHRSGSRRQLALIAIALASCILIGLGIRDRRSTSENIAVLRVYDSPVLLIDPDGSTIKIPAEGRTQPITLEPGQSIETTASMGTAEISYVDGTKIELLEGTRVKIVESSDGNKQLVLSSGMIQADVAPQRDGLPVCISTSTAELEILGTTLGVEASQSQTFLEVTSGLVAFTRVSDGQRIQVPDGHFAHATDSTDASFVATPFPELPSFWRLDLDQGLPPGWMSGELIEAEGRPAVVASQRIPGQGNVSISTHNAWQQGQHALFNIHDDTTLHLRFRQSDFARITVMVATRAFPPGKRRFGHNLFYTQKSWNEHVRPGEWTTVSIPLSQVGWYIAARERHSGTPELRGLAAYLIQVTTMDRDIDLTIDRIWVTRENHFEPSDAD